MTVGINKGCNTAESICANRVVKVDSIISEQLTIINLSQIT